MEGTEVRKLAALEDTHWWYRERRHLLTKALAGLRPGDALDIGAAGGGNTRVLRDLGWRPVALEFGSEGAEVAHEAGVAFHTDAVQAVGQLAVDFAASGVDALTLTGHKLGGPFGAGALLLGREVACTPLLHGGGQERDVRSGTFDTPALAGLATATTLACERQPATARRLASLRDDLVRRVLEAVPGAIYNGDPVDRLPGNAHFSFPGCEGDSLLLLLDARGVEVSTGSACSSGVARPSHVLVAMGQEEEQARSSLRFSLGHSSTASEVDALLEVLPAVVERARRVPVR